jgi:hypothetical protein
MARAQQTNTKKPIQGNTKKTNTKQNKQKVEPKRPEMSKKELMFYRGGMLIILLTVIVVTVVLVVRYIATNEQEDKPYENYIQLVNAEVRELTFVRGDGQYGDFTFFYNKPEYAEIARVIDSNDILYFYFYRSSDINDDITEAIKGIEGFEDLAFFFIDIDRLSNRDIFENPDLAHLPLNSTRNHQLIQFNVQTQTFTSDAIVSWILIELQKLS